MVVSFFVDTCITVSSENVSSQITERKPELAKLEALDCGKPYDEATWDMVYETPYGILQYSFWQDILTCFMFLFTRMMLLGVSSSLQVWQKPWTKSKIPLFLFHWKILNAILRESRLV